jgi:choline dehydrogenase
MSMAPSQLGLHPLVAEHRWPNVEYHVQPLSLDAFGEPLHRFDAFTASVCNLNPTSARPCAHPLAQAEDAPRIAANYLSTAEDRRSPPIRCA